MTYLLDTSILIDLLRVKPDAKNFIKGHSDDLVATSSVCEAEIYEGIYREKPENIADKKEVFLKLFEEFLKVIPFDSNQAEITGKLRATLSIRRSPIGDIDILIASAALSQNATLVTGNIKHFEKIPGLQVVSL